MRSLTEKDIHDAFKNWQRSYSIHNCRDSEGIGKLEQTRKALLLSTSTVAKNLRISRAGYCSLEESETKGSISLSTLTKAAEAMDCELVYLLRPKNKLNFAENIWNKILPAAIKHPWMTACDPKKKEKALAFIAKQFMNDPPFRKSQGWVRRSNET